MAGAGTSTSNAIAFGGLNASAYRAFTEEWNGASWSEVGDLNTARFALGSAGSYTAALAYGGSIPGGNTQATEEWSGSSILNNVLTD